VNSLGYLARLALLIMCCVTAAGAAPPAAVPELGSHPDQQTEWWYVTGWLSDDGHPVGFQITFFRSRIDGAPDNPSEFAAHQVMLAHAAVSDPRQGHVLFAQRTMRAAFDLAGASTTSMDAHIGRWRLQQAKAGEPVKAQIDSQDFSFQLEMKPLQAVLFQGSDDGISHKGPSPNALSHYYSMPHLSVSGSLVLNGKQQAVTGTAWLDHEWSDSYMDPKAQGWDWVGVNLADGGALMAFQMRGSDGTALWSGATQRDASGSVHYFAPSEVQFKTLSSWTSPHSAVRYPVAQQVNVGGEAFTLKPLMNDSEINANASTGTLYWEGPVRVFSATGQAAAEPAGEGYLEMTGYGTPLRLH
jgi:predicted secreted hydrolase